MNDVRYLCDLSLDTEAPPLREPAAALAIARRSADRRGQLAAAAVTGTAGLAVAATMLASGAAAPPGPSGLQPAAPGVSAPPSVSAAPTASRSPLTEAAYQQQVYRRLITALPHGYTGRTQYPLSTDQKQFRLDPPTAGARMLVFMAASVIVSDGTGEGQLWAYMANDGRPTPTGDLCALPEAGTACEVIDVDGVPIRISLQREDDHDNIVARRYLSSGWLEVIAQQSVPVYTQDGSLPPDGHSPQPQPGSRPPALRTPYLTRSQIAALAGSPDLLP